MGLWLSIGIGGAAALTGVGYGTWHPRCRWFAPVVYRGDASSPGRVALTFDDGPHADATPRLLDCLAEREVRAAFFVIGRHATQRPELLQRMDREGHLIASHSFDHAYHGMFRGYGYWRDQLARTEAGIADAIGRAPTLFRPPMGLKQPLLKWVLRRSGYTPVTWTRSALDGWPISTGRILQRLIEPSTPGDILTLHDGEDGHRRRDTLRVVEAMPRLIDGLRQRGLEPVRLDELIGMQPYRPAH